jgi:hypothetical protein
MKKLHKAAITLPAEPRPIILSFSAFTLDSLFYAGFVPLVSACLSISLKHLKIKHCEGACLAS